MAAASSKSLRRLRSAWVSAQSDQSLRCPHVETLCHWLPIKRRAKTLIKLGDAQAELSVRWVHTSFCWFCYAAAHLYCHTLLPKPTKYHLKTYLRKFSARYDSDRSAQLQRLARVLKFQI